MGELDEGFCCFAFGAVEDYFCAGVGAEGEGGLEGGELVVLLLLLALVTLLVLVLVWHAVDADGSGQAALSTRARSHHSPDPEDEGGVVHGDGVKVSETGLFEFLRVVEDLAGVPDGFAGL